MLALGGGCETRSGASAPTGPASAGVSSTAAPSPEAAPGSARAGTEAAAPALVFLGDSLTAGRGLELSEAVPARIQALVERAGLPYHVVNAGRSGDTTAGGLARLDWYLRDAVNLQALVIGLGSNDAMRGVPLSNLRDNLRRIIEQTRQARPTAKIFLWAMKTFPNLGEPYRSQYEGLFREVAEAEEVTLLPFPLEGVAGNPELNQPDGIHPTAEGASLVAERIWETLGPRLATVPR